MDCPTKMDAATYQKASLQNYTYTQGKMMFNPQNIRLGGQTPLSPLRVTARTPKGVHLHVSVNNQQHHLSNENIFEYPLENGSYDLFAFLADSYYESIKVPEAILGKRIEIRNGQLAASRPIEEVALVYNVPIGTYEINEKDSILFDFVLYKTKLEKEGNYVTVQINQQVPIHIKKWQPYYLTGFSEGEYQIILTLHNADGKAIAPPTKNNFTIKLLEENSKN